MTIHISLLSGLRAEDGARVISDALRPRAQRLLAYLLVAGDRPLSREQIAFSLWPDTSEKAALGALRRALSESRKALPPFEGGGWIIETAGGLRWNDQAPCRVDLWVYESLLNQGTPAALHEAVDLYSGDLLAGWDENWLYARREQLRQGQFSALRQLAAHHRSIGATAVALEFARRAAAFEPLSEGASRDLMTLLYEQGDRPAALVEYERLRSMLLEELGVEPMQESRNLHLAIVQGAALPEPRVPAPVRTAHEPLPRLIGREREFSRLRELWEAAGQGRGQIAVLSGEAGIGKSLLVRHQAEAVLASGGLVLIGHCYEFEQALPFQPILEMLRGAGGLLGHAELAPAHRAALAQLAPELLGAGGETASSRFAEAPRRREQLFEGLLQAFIALARQQSLLLVLEDVHWAAESTLDWLVYSAPRLGGHRVLALITYRIGEIDPAHGLSRLERRFAREAALARFPLGALSRVDCQELVAQLLGLDADKSVRLADQLFDMTAGNPFFLRELVRTIRGAGEPEDLADLPLPESIREAIDARVERLSELSQMVLRNAAVAGRVFDHEVVRQSGDWTEEQSLSALEELLDRRIIQAEQDGTFSFSHHLVQEAIYAGLTGPRREYLHRRLARAIEAHRPDDVEGLVHHLIPAGEDGPALEYCLQAAERAESVFAFEEAAAYREMALGLADKLGGRERKLTALEGLADSLRLMRHAERAVEAYSEALELWRAGSSREPITGIRLYRKILQTTAGMWGRSRFRKFERAARESEELRRRLAEVLPSTGDPPLHPETVRLLKALANDALVTRFPPALDQALEYAQRAVALARRLDSPVELSTALAILGSVRGARGQYRERVALYRQRLELIQDPRFDNPRERLRVLNGLGSALVHVGEYREAAPLLREGEILANELRAVDLQAQALSMLYQCWFRLDDWEAAAEVERRRQALLEEYTLEQLGSPCFAIALSSVVAARRGDLERAHQLHQESNEIMIGISGPQERWTRSQHF